MNDKLEITLQDGGISIQSLFPSSWSKFLAHLWFSRSDKRVVREAEDLFLRMEEDPSTLTSYQFEQFLVDYGYIVHDPLEISSPEAHSLSGMETFYCLKESALDQIKGRGRDLWALPSPYFLSHDSMLR